MSLIQPEGETLKLIREKLNENVETRQQYLTHIKEWLKNEPHLPDELDDQRILIFLRSCKFSLERCKKKLDLFFTVRTAFPEFFADRDVYSPEIQKVIQAFNIYLLPKVTPEGYRMLLVRCKDTNVKDVNFTNTIKLVFMIGDVRLAEENVAGDVYILDLAAITPRYMTTLTPSLFKKFLVCTLDAYPVRVKAFHMINVWPWLKAIIESLKPLIKEKIRNRLFFHSDINELHKHVPRELLPHEYGGQVGAENDLQDAWMKIVERKNGWFKEQENFKANESLRRDKSASYNELFGVPGSFQKLNID